MLLMVWVGARGALGTRSVRPMAPLRRPASPRVPWRAGDRSEYAEPLCGRPRRSSWTGSTGALGAAAGCRFRAHRARDGVASRITAASLVVLVIVAELQRSSFWSPRSLAVSLFGGSRCSASWCRSSPRWCFGMRRSKRRKAFGEQLDETLQIIASALRAGHSLAACARRGGRAKRRVADVRGVRARSSTRTASAATSSTRMSTTADRMGSAGLPMGRRGRGGAAGHRRQPQRGDRQGRRDDPRAQPDLREVRTRLAAEGKFSAVVLMALPIVAGAGMSRSMNPGYMAAACSTGMIGRFMLLSSRTRALRRRRNLDPRIIVNVKVRDVSTRSDPHGED